MRRIYIYFLILIHCVCRSYYFRYVVCLNFWHFVLSFSVRTVAMKIFLLSKYDGNLRLIRTRDRRGKGDKERRFRVSYLCLFLR